MITTAMVAKKLGVSVKTLARWADRGVIPKPAVATHPSGRGKIGYWPDHVLERCRRIVALRKKGHALETAVAMVQTEDFDGLLQSLELPTMADVFSRKMTRTPDGRQVDLMQIFLAVIAVDLKASPVDRDLHGPILAQIRKKDLLRGALNLIQNGYNAVIVYDGKDVRIEADFLLSHVNGIQAFIAIPVRPAFCRFMAAIGAQKLVRDPTVTPAPKVWIREGDVLVEYSIFLGGLLGFELIRETATVIGRTHVERNETPLA
jgi:DNA-binding transcriptional MerR regulator